MVQLDYNCFFQFNTIGGQSSMAAWKATVGSPDQHGINQDGLLSSPTFRPPLVSPLVNGGIYIIPPIADITGSIRPQGRGWNIGAHQFMATVEPPTNVRVVQ